MVQPKGVEDTPPEPEAEGSSNLAATSTSTKTSEKADAESKPKTEPKAKPVKQQGYAFLFKYVLVGDSGVGKTAFIQRFTKDSFVDVHTYTIGVDFDIKTMDLPNGDEVKLQMWDTAGQERFRNITYSYYRGAHAVIVVYAVNDNKSCDSVPYWVEQALNYGGDNTLVIVVGTKTDLTEEGQVTFGVQEMTQHLKDKGLMEKGESEKPGVYAVYEVSAKTGRVEEAFRDVTDQLVTRRLNSGFGDETHEMFNTRDNSLRLYGLDGSQPKSSCCCIL